MERERFQKKILRMKSEEIYSSSYQIECVVNISDCLLEKSEKMSEDILCCLIVLPNILGFFYNRWMKTGDSFQQELEASMDSSIREVMKKAGEQDAA